ELGHLSNSCQIVRVTRQIHTLSQRVALGPELLRQPLADDDYAQGAFIVLLREVPPLYDPGSHCLEVSRRDHRTGRGYQRLTGLHDIALGIDQTAVLILPQRNGACGPCRSHTRHTTNSLERPIHKQPNILAGRVWCLFESDLSSHDSLGLESRIRHLQVVKTD